MDNSQKTELQYMPMTSRKKSSNLEQQYESICQKSIKNNCKTVKKHTGRKLKTNKTKNRIKKVTAIILIGIGVASGLKVGNDIINRPRPETETNKNYELQTAINDYWKIFKVHHPENNNPNNYQINHYDLVNSCLYRDEMGQEKLDASAFYCLLNYEDATFPYSYLTTRYNSNGKQIRETREEKVSKYMKDTNYYNMEKIVSLISHNLGYDHSNEFTTKSQAELLAEDLGYSSLDELLEEGKIQLEAEYSINKGRGGR